MPRLSVDGRFPAKHFWRDLIQILAKAGEADFIPGGAELPLCPYITSPAPSRWRKKLYPTRNFPYEFVHERNAFSRTGAWISRQRSSYFVRRPELGFSHSIH